MPDAPVAPQTISLTDIYLSSAARLRNDYGDIEKLAQSLIRRGQLQPIVVRAFNSEEFPSIPEDKYRYVLVDGGRRMFATALVYKLDKEIPNIPRGEIMAIPSLTDDPIFALEQEFHANQDRKNFDWKERMQYIKRIHDYYTDLDSNWGTNHTADLVQLGLRSVQAYLQLATNPEITSDPRIESCSSFRTAWKKFQIISEERKRKKRVATEVESPLKRVRHKAAKESINEIEGESSSSDDIVSPTSATSFIHQGDCRDWIGQFEDEKFNWIHWDPPYGHEQSGKALVHDGFEDSQDYAHELISAMVPEIHRVLKPGHWLAIWYHPLEYQWLYDLLSSTGFWVNPYPNIWVKDRKSDGHDIKRYLLNDHEEFLLACKTDKDHEPILPDTERSNVFKIKTLARSQRRHVTHKPPLLLAEILSILSYEGEIGLDPTVGSGSLLEAAFLTGRPAVGCELDEAYWLGACDALQKIFDGDIQTLSDLPTVST